MMPRVQRSSVMVKNVGLKKKYFIISTSKFPAMGCHD